MCETILQIMCCSYKIVNVTNCQIDKSYMIISWFAKSKNCLMLRWKNYALRIGNLKTKEFICMVRPVGDRLKNYPCDCSRTRNLITNKIDSEQNSNDFEAKCLKFVSILAFSKRFWSNFSSTLSLAALIRMVLHR